MDIIRPVLRTILGEYGVADFGSALPDDSVERFVAYL